MSLSTGGPASTAKYDNQLLAKTLKEGDAETNHNLAFVGKQMKRLADKYELS